MRATLIMFLLITIKVNATTYYVSNAGNDANDGLTPETSWQTLAKVNTTVTSGDTVKLKCNDTWTVATRLIPASSNIYYTSYSTGAKPLVTGFVNATVGSPTANVYTINVPDAVADLKTVLINGKLAIKARYPNSTYLTATATTDSTLTIQAADTANIVGKKIVVRSAHWILDNVTVIEKTGLVIKVTPKLTYDPDALGCNGYFKQNDESYLDATNEFVFDSVNKVLKVYATSTPTVQYSTADTLVWMRQKDNITVDGIQFTGANKAVFQLDTCNYITIQNCTLNNNGTNAIVFKRNTYPTIANDSILNTLNNAIMTTKNNSAPYVTDPCTAITITGNYIKNTGIYPGMGVSNNNQYFAINICADSSNINNNLIDSSGYTPLQWNGLASTIEKNYVTNYCFAKDDGGGVYTVKGSPPYYGYSGGSVVRNNIVLHGKSATNGTVIGSAFSGGSAGVYLDDYTDSITVEYNTVYDVTHYAFNLRSAKHITAKYNTFIDSLTNVFNLTGSTSDANNYNFKHNIYYQKNASYYIVTHGSLSGYSYDSDSNYCIKPVAESSLFRYNSTNYSLSGYAAASGQEVHSNGMPGGYTLAYNDVLIYNPTNADSTVTLDDTYIDVQGNIYVNEQEITLTPFESKLLFRYQYNYTKSQNYFIPH